VIPRLHLVLGAQAFSRSEIERELESIDALGEPLAVHLRAREWGGRRLLEVAREVQAQPNLLLLINDRIDVALAADARGAHLAQHSMDAGAARELLGPDRLIGASVHSLAEAEAPRVKDADFFFVGSMFPTRSHPGRTPEGVTILTDIVERTTRPCIAIGGISPERVEVLGSRGAYGVAVRSGVWDRPDPALAVRSYLKALAGTPLPNHPE